MTKATDEVSTPAKAPAAPVTSHKRTGIVDDYEEKRAAINLERGDGVDAGADAPRAGHTTEDLIALIQGMAKQLDTMNVAYEKLSESQQKMRDQMEADARFSGVARVTSPPMNSGLFASGLRRGSRMHIDSLGGSPQTPPTRMPTRAVQPLQYFGQQQPGNGMPLSHLQRLFNAAQAEEAAAEQAAARIAADRAARAGAAGVQMQEDLGQGHGAQGHAVPAGFQQQQQPVMRYPDARQKKLMIRSFGGKELYVGLGSGFLEWGRRFERQANIAQSACGFPWPKDVKVDLFGHYMASTAANYFNKQVDAWWAQLPTLQYVMEKMLETFKTTITPAQAMKLFTATKDPKRSWPEHYMYLVVISEACGNSADYLVLNNIVQYASADLRTVLMAKVDGSQTDYLQHAEELAQFAQSWEIETGKGKNFGRDVVSSVRERRKETRRCHKCGEVGRLRAACPARNNPDIVLAVNDTLDGSDDIWILDSGSSRHLVNDASYLDDVDQCDDQCVQPIGEPLAISMKGSMTLRVAACGVEQIVRLSNVYFAKNVVHNLVSYGQLLKVGYTLAHRGGRRVVADKKGGKVAFDVDLRQNVLVGFYQILMRESDIPLTAVSTPSGMLWEWLVMPQGLKNAPATFNRCVTHLLRSVRDFAPSYFDDVYVHSRAVNKKTDDEMHKEHLRELVGLMRKHKLYANLKKCIFGASEIPVLGCLVGKNGVRPDTEKVRVINEWPTPSNVKGLRQFLGLATVVERDQQNLRRCWIRLATVPRTPTIGGGTPVDP